VCASPAYLQSIGKRLSPADLVHTNCLVHTRLGRDWIFYPQAGNAGAEPEVVSVNGNFSSNDVMALLQACMAGRGIACLPAIPIAAHIRSGALINLFPQHRLNDLGIYALTAAQRSQSSASRALQDFLTKDLAQKHI
jgi:DNA-binding transcriptional LysR family regulator